MIADWEQIYKRRMRVDILQKVATNCEILRKIVKGIVEKLKQGDKYYKRSV